MNHTSMTKHLFLLFATCCALGCSKAGKAGCGGASSTEEESVREVRLDEGGPPTGSAPSAASNLVGVYDITSYQQSEGTCDQLTDITDGPSYLVLYLFEPADGSSTRLGGAFCEDPDRCRAVAQQGAEPPIGYSFISGDDASGWQGWAILDTGSLEGKCRAHVQSHRLRASGPNQIEVDTKTVEVFFAPTSEEGGIAKCSNRQAIGVASQNPGCKSRLVLAAQRDTGQ